MSGLGRAYGRARRTQAASGIWRPGSQPGRPSLRVPQPGRVAPGGPPRLPEEARATAIGRRALGREGERAQASGYSDQRLRLREGGGAAAAADPGGGGVGAGEGAGPRAEGPSPPPPGQAPFLALKGHHYRICIQLLQQTFLKAHYVSGAVLAWSACKNGIAGVLPKLASNSGNKKSTRKKNDEDTRK